MAKRRLFNTITEEELIKVVAAEPKQFKKVAYLLGFYECMRISEITTLKPEHIVLERKLIYIKQGKGDKDRNIPISPKLPKGLRNHLPLKCGVRCLELSFKAACTIALGKDIGCKLRFHDLRHSGATHYLNKDKWDIRQLQVFLGHSRIATTEIYTHVSPEDLINKMWGIE